MFFLILALAFSVASAVPTGQTRIVGGSATTINNYPEIAALLYSWNGILFFQECGSIIISSRAVLTAAHCPFGDAVSRWRVRVGSTWANSGGTVVTLSSITIHSNYDPRTLDSDLAILRSRTEFVFSNVVQVAALATPTHHVADNQVVWAAGWGVFDDRGLTSEQLRHVQVWKINQVICRQRYGGGITDNMICSGWLDVGGRDQCQGDSGGPLYHNRVVVGVCSWGYECAHRYYPGVNVRVSRFYNWIRANL